MQVEAWGWHTKSDRETEGEIGENSIRLKILRSKPNQIGNRNPLGIALLSETRITITPPPLPTLFRSASHPLSWLVGLNRQGVGPVERGRAFSPVAHHRSLGFPRTVSRIYTKPSPPHPFASRPLYPFWTDVRASVRCICCKFVN